MKRTLLLVPLAATLCGCELGPNYARPAAPVPSDYRESRGWMPASPQQAAGWEDWWAIYNDPVLDALEKQVDISNQNLKAAEAAYRVARAEVGIERGALLPTFTANASVRKTGGGSRNTIVGAGDASGTSVVTNSSRSSTTYQTSLGGSWDLDVWGRIRRTVEGGVATAQASAADIAAARLSAQSLLAVDYFQLRAADEEAQLLNATIQDFELALQIARNRFQVGIATEADVLAAQTQIDNVQAQLVNLQLTRAEMEHAIATLTGKPPSELAVAATNLPTIIPVVPAGVPSTLLERRPDIASSEYTMAAANADIGVAIAAWYPDLTLTGSYGFASSSLGSLFSAPNSVWSLGPSLAEVIFNGGAREAQTEQARARYDQAVATYRQTVLTAFQQVEDQLAALRVLEQQAAVENQTVSDARRSEELALNQYRAGTADFTTVITAQTTRFNAENAALSVLNQRLAASVNFVVALGGGWDNSRLPQPGFFYRLPEVTANDGPSQAATPVSVGSP
ncbi:MAG TPA: efflux transporter outer membrane subunit [Micropepsaceae bacterium]|jgi:NodT family efflux transporter outer membrane factor (OMF) lipoprotein|nr:efflux transporter outer membrane subunit [Micropepsaceae bacterium]